MLGDLHRTAPENTQAEQGRRHTERNTSNSYLLLRAQRVFLGLRLDLVVFVRHVGLSEVSGRSRLPSPRIPTGTRPQSESAMGNRG